MSDFINHAMCHETKSDDNNGSDNDKVIMLAAIKVWWRCQWGGVIFLGCCIPRLLMSEPIVRDMAVHISAFHCIYHPLLPVNNKRRQHFIFTNQELSSELKHLIGLCFRLWMEGNFMANNNASYFSQKYTFHWRDKYFNNSSKTPSPN